MAPSSLRELAGGEQLARADGIAERRVRVGFAPAVADGAADIEAGPGPRRADRRLEHHGPIDARGCNVERSARIEFVVEADAHEIFRDAGSEGDRERSRIRRQHRGGRDVTEIQVKIFDLAGPVATETDLRAGARRPPCLRLLAEEGGACGIGAGDDDGDIDGDLDRVTIGVDIDRDARGDTVGQTETRAADGARGLDPADCETAGRVDQGFRRRCRAEAGAQRPEPLQPLLHSRTYRRIEFQRTERRIAGRASAVECRRPPRLT